MINIVIRAWYERQQLRVRITFDEVNARNPRSVVTDSVEDACRIITNLIESKRLNHPP